MYGTRQEEHFTPEDQEEPIEPEPEPIIFDFQLLFDAIDAWNSVMVEYQNILYAEVIPIPVIEIDISVEVTALPSQQSGAIIEDIRGDWRWNERSKIYRNPKTKQSVVELRQVRLRDTFTDIREVNLKPTFDRLFDGRITLQQWRNIMGDTIEEQYLAEYMFGRGGINAMTDDDLLEITRLVNEQKRFLNGFTEDIRRGMLTEPQIRARGELYIESSSQAFETGKASSYGIRLPQYPGDGNQICRANCRCHWDLRETEGGINAFWRLDVRAAHCDTCLRNSRDWNPLFVERR